MAELVLGPDLLDKYEVGLERVDDNFYKSNNGFLFLREGKFSHFAVNLPVQDKLVNEVPKIYSIAKRLGAKVDKVLISDYTNALDWSHSFFISAEKSRFNYAKIPFLCSNNIDFMEQLLPNFKIDKDYIKMITEKVDSKISKIGLTFKIDEATDLEYTLNKPYFEEKNFTSSYKIIKYPVKEGERKSLEEFSDTDLISHLQYTLKIILPNDLWFSQGFAFRTAHARMMYLCPPGMDDLHINPPIDYHISQENYKFRIIHPWQLCYENDIGLGVRIDSIHAEVHNKPILILEDKDSIDYFSKHFKTIKKIIR